MAGFTPAERQRQRLKKKLAAKSKAEANEENASPADVAKALEVAQGGSDDRGTAALAGGPRWTGRLVECVVMHVAFARALRVPPLVCLWSPRALARAPPCNGPTRVNNILRRG